MACTPLPGGGFVCSRGYQRPRCSVANCSRPAAYACDHALEPGAPRATCDRRLCSAHAHIQPGKLGADGSPTCHYCPAHHAAAERAAAERRAR